MKQCANKLLVAIFLFATEATAQDALPTRAFQRFGTTKLRHGSRILCLAYSHNEKKLAEGGDNEPVRLLAAGGGNDPVRLWNAKTGKLIRELNEPWVQAIVFTPTDKTLLYGGYQKSVRLWNLEQNKEAGRLDGHKSAIKAILVTPDIGEVVTASQDGAVFRWNFNTRSKVGELVGHTDEVNALAYTDLDNGMAISAGNDRTIILWDLEKNAARHKLDAGCAVLALAVSADGKTLYSAGDDHLIRRWDLTTRQQTGTFKGHEASVVSLSIHGDTLVSGGLDKSIRYWNARTTEPIRSLPRRPGDSDAFAVTKDGDFVATAGTNNAIRIFESATGKEVNAGDGIASGIAGLSLSADNKRLATITSDGQILVRDLTVNKLLRQWDSKQTGEFVIAYANDGKTLATVSTSARIWNAENGGEIARLPIETADPVVAVAWSSDGKSIAIGMPAGVVDLWDVKDKKIVGSFKYAGSLHAVAWSPDGKKLAAAGGAKIIVWEVPTRTIYKEFDLKEGPTPTVATIKCLAFASDNKTLAAGGFDAVTRVYNLDHKTPADPKVQKLCEGHLSAVYSVAFSPDGRTVVTGSFDRTTRIWEAFSGKQIAVFKGHIGEVTGVAFANDGRSVFSAGADTVAYHWNVPGLLNTRKLPVLTLTPGELEESWTTLLTEDTPRGHETMWKCIASAKQAVPYLTKEKKVYLLDPDRVKKLFKDLDSPHFPTRTAAMNELSGYGRWMEGRYDAAISNPPSLEYKRRIEILKEKLTASGSPSLAQERLRVRRIMLMCEQAGGADAIAALKLLAERGPEEEIREEAQASLSRLKQ